MAPRSQPGSNEWLYDTLQDVRRELMEAHNRHGAQLNSLRAELAQLGNRLSEHDEADQLVENRVLTMEVERRHEREHRATEAKKVAVDNSRIAVVVSSAVAVIAEIVKSTWDFYHLKPGS